MTAGTSCSVTQPLLSIREGGRGPHRTMAQFLHALPDEKGLPPFAALNVPFICQQSKKNVPFICQQSKKTFNTVKSNNTKTYR